MAPIHASHARATSRLKTRRRGDLVVQAGMLWLVLGGCRAPSHLAPSGPAPKLREPQSSVASLGKNVSQETSTTPFELVRQQLLEERRAVIPPLSSLHPVHSVYNREAIIPPMCYTQTEGVHNPCYVCHQDAKPGRPNTMNDGGIQTGYSFSDVGLTNHWRNLFTDRLRDVEQLSDAFIQDWVTQENYSNLRPRLEAEGFEGYLPDLANLDKARLAFDSEGFAVDGSSWVAFSYKPLPSTFWPTNGSTDDVMIRLPEPFRSDAKGRPSRAAYQVNLALVEANIKGLEELSIPEVDESLLGEDVDGDGELSIADRVVPTKHYVGGAKRISIRPYLYPHQTEFIHSVRYLSVEPDGTIGPSARMKELRYMRKGFMLTRDQLYEEYLQERSAKEMGQLPGYIDRGHLGLDNGMGWQISGFIENPDGDLRFNTFEENLSCMGCHSSVGSTIDQTFAFPRKIDGKEGWGYIDLKGMPDAPSRGESDGEIHTYLKRAGGGGEFRSNPEMEAKWFEAGVPNDEKLSSAKDVYTLITPSTGRAIQLNKAYFAIVKQQSFLYGKDATATPPANVYATVAPETAPTLPESRRVEWDLLLDWSAATPH